MGQEAAQVGGSIQGEELVDGARRKIRGQHPGGGASGRRDQKARIRTKASEHGDQTPQREDLPESDRMAPDQWAYGTGYRGLAQLLAPAQRILLPSRKALPQQQTCQQGEEPRKQQVGRQQG